jgi:para-aminobenzoate synthetase
MVVNRPSILFIDAYDSFTNNIISLLTTTLTCSVRVVHIDSPGFETEGALCNELTHYDAVVCGPGPGDPSNQKDVGLMNWIWKLQEEDVLPVLGICLGFQSLCLAFGGHMQTLNEGLHGRVRRINHIGETVPKDTIHGCEEIFDGVDTLRATLYHSLYVGTNQNEMDEEQWEERKWEPINNSGHLLPLAWAENESKERMRWKDYRILMAVRHKTKPFWGLQYHPESICSNEQARMVIENWFTLAQRWNRDNGRRPQRDGIGIRGEFPVLKSLLSKVEQRKRRRLSQNDGQKPRLRRDSVTEYIGVDCHYEMLTLDLPDHISIPDIAEHVQVSQRDHIVLESSNAYIQGPGAAAVRGRYSIIALDVDDALRIEYHAKDKWARVYSPCFNGRTSCVDERVNLKAYGGIWPFLADFLEKRHITDGNEKSPFWGGFMGYTTYELGLEGIGVDTIPDRLHTRPDLCFAWITRSLVLDHVEKKIYVQQLLSNEMRGLANRLEETVSLLQPLFRISNGNGRRRNSKSNANVFDFKAVEPSVTIPNSKVYESKVRACQQQIRRGESYELCLTDQTRVTLHRTDALHRLNPHADIAGYKITQPAQHNQLSHATAWRLYKSLRLRNPAPFASFLRLGPATFISGSPERFLSWSSSGKCSLRPMKGTVKKSPQVSTLAQAEALLQVPKEQAENLMIVDLVRHDLHGVCGSGNVSVPRLMVVEEYASVFQMITVVEGQIPQVSSGKEGARTRYTGMDVLAASLPPGSMTGAPKKRSCEILQEIEDKERSLYSGVVGYMDVGGRGDFSVNIRCMFRWDDEGETTSACEDTELSGGDMQDTEAWHIGAGGAVTALSTPIAEREEMQTKLAGTLGVFVTSPGKG